MIDPKRSVLGYVHAALAGRGRKFVRRFIKRLAVQNSV